MAIDEVTFRTVVGSFATGVTVITTGRDGVYHGMTANAFSSLSLDPMLVLICVDRSAHTYPVLDECGYFNVHILAEGQQSISVLFANKSLQEAHNLLGVEFDLGDSGVPVLRGCLAHLECRITDRYAGGDHTIFVGEVEAAQVDEARRPLIYFRSAYRNLAE